MVNRVAQLRALKMKMQNGCCYYCGQPMWRCGDAAFLERFNLSPRQASLFLCTAEHLVARSDGGSTVEANIVAACRFCNQTRHKARKLREPVDYTAHVRRRIERGGWQRLPPETV
jgi:5-methylcytosine-specific restriction endonuclease McrA